MKPMAKAFTLIEMLIVISVILLLMAILVPAVNAALQGAKISETQSRIQSLSMAIHDYKRVYNAFPPSTSPDRDMKPGPKSYPMYHYPVEYEHSSKGMTTEAENIFLNPRGTITYGGKFLAYFLVGPRGTGWHRPKAPSPTAWDYPLRHLTAEWDVPQGILAFFENSPVSKGAPTSDKLRFPVFIDAFGLGGGRNGGTIAYVRAEPYATGDGAERFPRGWNSGPMNSAFYWDCRSHPSYPGDGKGNAQQDKIFEQCPHDVIIISPGPDRQFGYRATVLEHKGKDMWGSWSCMDHGVIDDVANFELK